MKKTWFRVVALLLVLLPAVGWAQLRVVRGEAAASVQGGAASAPTEQERAAVLYAAKLNAWRSFLAMPGQEERVDQVRANERAFTDRLDELLVDVVITDENYNKDAKRYTVRIKATVAESVLNSMIRTSSRAAVREQAGEPPSAGGTRGALVMFLGMSREADVIKSFMEKETRVTESAVDRAQSESSKEQVRGGAGGRTASVSGQASTSVTTRDAKGGSREQKRDRLTYRVGNTSVLNGSLPRILLQNGIQATPYSFLMRPCQLPNPDSFSRQYAASEQGELPSDVMADIQDRLANCRRAKYWVFASMESGGYRTDPNTGLNLATVTVSVQLMDVETGAQLASATKDVSGRSGDQSDALKVATGNAVQAVGDIVAAQVAALKR